MLSCMPHENVLLSTLQNGAEGRESSFLLADHDRQRLTRITLGLMPLLGLSLLCSFLRRLCYYARFIPDYGT